MLNSCQGLYICIHIYVIGKYYIYVCSYMYVNVHVATSITITLENIIFRLWAQKQI